MVQRYHPSFKTGEMISNEHGAYVLYKDFEVVIQLLNAIEIAVQGLDYPTEMILKQAYAWKIITRILAQKGNLEWDKHEEKCLEKLIREGASVS